MQQSCGCDHTCRCSDVWKCILKPIGFGLLGLVVVSALANASREPGNVVELVLCGSIALCVLAMACIVIGGVCSSIWSFIKSRRATS